MRIKTTLLFIVASLAAGCATQQPYMWVRPDTTKEQFDQDYARCVYEASAAVATYGSGQPTARTTGGAIGQGLAIGYGQAAEYHKLGQLCMRARGYRQAPVGPNAVPAS